MIRTPAQYVESLRDGRVIYLDGERMPDITKEPKMRGVINAVAMTYHLANDPEWQDVITVEEDGDRIMFLWNQPKSVEDLVRRREVYKAGHHMGGRIPGMGPDAMAAAGVVAARMDKELGTHYTDAVEDFRKHLKTTDPAITGAITDVKGNRSLRPSAQVQHKDFFVRVVDRQKDGIVVRGAKVHISATPTANEIIVSPSRAHREEDKDYALVFATPVNAKGITLITHPTNLYGPDEEQVQWDWPTSGRGGGVSECLIVFDDVFVPWNRVFMCGEYQYSRDMAWLFGVFHRLYGTCGRSIEADNMVGMAALMAEYNGLERYSHIQEKLAMLAMHAQSIEILAMSACEHPEVYPDLGLVAPSISYTNIAKYMYANDHHEMTKLVADIAGGLAADTFSYKDWMNPEIRPFLEKYMAGKNGIPTEHRLKALRLVKDMVSGRGSAAVIHTEGSLAAQKMALYAYGDWERYKALAKRLAGIPGWEEHPVVKGFGQYPSKWVI